MLSFLPYWICEYSKHTITFRRNTTSYPARRFSWDIVAQKYRVVAPIHDLPHFQIPEILIKKLVSCVPFQEGARRGALSRKEEGQNGFPGGWFRK